MTSDMKLKYPSLCGEIEVLNQQPGFVGILDALIYIQENASDYRGTQCWRELQAFKAEMMPMFA